MRKFQYTYIIIYSYILDSIISCSFTICEYNMVSFIIVLSKIVKMWDVRVYEEP